MKFSILVPVYNVEEYLEPCLESVFNQTYNNYEVVLVDDGSTDKSGSICDAYIEKHPNVGKVIHKENQGLISARRAGIHLAESDFCIFVDSDDFIDYTLLENLAMHLEKNEKIDILMYALKYCIDGKIEGRFPKDTEMRLFESEEEKTELFVKFACTTEYTSLCTKAIKTELLKADPTNYELYYEYNMSEDLLQSIYPIVNAQKVMYIADTLYTYRINLNSISRSFYPETIRGKNTLHVYNMLLSYSEKYNLEGTSFYKRLNARWFNDFMYMMSKYYENCKSRHDKRRVITFKWENMLPENAYDAENEFEVDAYKKLYCWLINGNSKKIEIYFVRKKWYQQIRKWKRAMEKILPLRK